MLCQHRAQCGTIRYIFTSMFHHSTILLQCATHPPPRLYDELRLSGTYFHQVYPLYHERTICPWSAANQVQILRPHPTVLPHHAPTRTVQHGSRTTNVRVYQGLATQRRARNSTVGGISYSAPIRIRLSWDPFIEFLPSLRRAIGCFCSPETLIQVPRQSRIPGTGTTHSRTHCGVRPSRSGSLEFVQQRWES